jgi:hypothetical protein
MHCVSFLVPSDLPMLTLPIYTHGADYDFSNPIRKAETPEHILLDEAPCWDTIFQHAKGSGIPAALRASHLVMELLLHVQEQIMLRVFVFSQRDVRMDSFGGFPDVPPFVVRLAALRLSSGQVFRCAFGMDAAL